MYPGRYPPETQVKVSNVCVKSLLGDRIEEVSEYYQILRSNGKHGPLQRLRLLFYRLPETFEYLLKQDFRFAEAKLAEQSGCVDDAVYTSMFVDLVSTIHRHFEDIAMSTFTARLTPAMLAKHIDALLRRKDHHGTRDLHTDIDNAMTLFKFVDDKDLFQIYYATLLARRLLRRISVTDDIEERMIVKFQVFCGAEYCRSFREMLIDLELSQDLTREFRAWQLQGGGESPSFHVKLLSARHWTSLNVPDMSFGIPPEILPLYNRFSTFYSQKHPKRRLMWLWDHSMTELQTNCFDKRYKFLTNPIQMVMLLQYNDHEILSVEELRRATSLSADVIDRMLLLFIGANIVKLEGDHQYRLNFGFKSKKICLNLISRLSPASTETETTEKLVVQENIELHRKNAIQATIVRIMKAKQAMKGQILIQEVIAQLSKRFVPQVADIKKAIDILLEKEYIERMEESSDTFVYIT
ncbi:uncharacterized protein FIBRA_06980 [Fibroporia radiculosa]|uniref:Cullin family profile domain-containing protein n=1 Tax=Fibroporia radiculosa TaxID=599839 RepID=J4HZY5_9APHY|nr:uncharacterized protein FIBRA_06980 [Fibroporia radiculosa]CCM04787.1 predicted protein [Fibroporia radiculosa]